MTTVVRLRGGAGTLSRRVLRGVSGGGGGGVSEGSRPVAPRARSISCRRRAEAAGHAYPATVNATPPLGICGACTSPR